MADFDRWLAEIQHAYADRIRPERLVPGYTTFVSSYCTTLVVNPEAVMKRQAERGVETRRWWGDGVAAQLAYRNFPHDPLPNTEWLADHALSLPFSPDMTDADVDFVCAGL